MNVRLLATTVVLISFCPSLWASIWNIPSQFATIQAGLNAAAIGDTVLVQPGIYSENILWPTTQNLSLLSAGSSTNTIIDGSGTNRVLEFDASVVSSFTVRNARLRGFTIQNGYATAPMDAYGGGIYSRGFHLDLEDLVFRNNTVFAPRRAHGGGMYVYRDGRIFNYTNVEFIDNTAQNDGSVSSGGALGAGLYADAFSQSNFTGVKFLNNSCLGQISSQGSALYSTRGNGTWLNVLADGNDCQTVTGTGSAGATVHVRDQGNFTVRGLSITNNTASTNNLGNAAGLYVLTTTFSVDSLNVSCNTANYGAFADAAGIILDGGSSARTTFTATNSLISNNLLNRTSAAFPGATGVFLDDRTDAAFINCTIADNASPGTGNPPIANGIGLGTNDNNLTLQNCILNNPGFPELAGPGVVATYSCINGGFAGTGNISTPPNFVGGGDYHLLPTSPCIDAGLAAGSPAFDLEGNSRPQGSGIDMGAFEGTGSGTLVQACSIDFIPLAEVQIALSATSVPDQRVLLEWDAEGMQDQLMVQRSQDGSTFVDLSQEASSQKNWVDENPPMGTIFYRLRGQTVNGETVLSETQTVLVAFSSKLQLLAYPNPASTNLCLQLSSDEFALPTEVELFRNDGQLMARKTLPANRMEMNFSLDMFPVGNYLVRVRRGAQQAVQSIVVAR